MWVIYVVADQATFERRAREHAENSFEDRFSAVLRPLRFIGFLHILRRHFKCRKNSRLPVAPVIGDGVMRDARQAGCVGRGRHPRDDGLVHGWIGDQAILADLVASRLELRLDERDDVRVRPRTGGSAGKM